MVQFSQCSNVSQKVKRIIRYLIDILTFKRESEPRWKLSYWTEKEREYGFRSTFFLSANISQRHENDTTYWLSSKVDYNGKKARLSQIAKELEEDGWEIGLHGSMNSYRDSNLLLKELDLLINNTHCKVTGIRQHYLRFDIRNTWHIHEALHLQYDTTLGYDNRIGFRGGIALPFVPYDLDNEREYKLLEIPMCIMDSSLFFVTGEKLDIEKSLKRCQNIVDNIKQTSGLLVINFHPHFYAAPYPDWWKVYDSILERLSNDCAWVANASKIAGWWTEKCKLVSEE
jgi:peptidoglycan/xylan/chitin deacetylase (PgdA/CDA1 family)